MKELNVHDELASLVPPPSREPAMPDLVARAKGVQRRRTAVLASASLAVVAALAVAVPALDVFQDEGTTNIAANDPGGAGSGGYAGGGADLDCGTEDGVTAGTVYAPPVLDTPRAALEEELEHRRVSVTADDFTKASETDDRVRYEVRRDGDVQAIAVASRAADGWKLDILMTCAALDE
jgi:hypothetical protein